MKQTLRTAMDVKHWAGLKPHNNEVICGYTLKIYSHLDADLQACTDIIS